MQDFQRQWCLNVLNSMAKRPMSALVLEPPADCKVPIDLDGIRAKISASEYISIFDWAMDVYYYLYGIRDFYDDAGSELRFTVVDGFIHWVSSKVRKSPKTEAAVERNEIRPLFKRVSAILDVMKASLNPDAPEEPDKPRGRRPPPALMKNEEFEELQARLNKVEDKETLLKIYSILNEHMPELRFGAVTEVSRSQLPRKCVRALKAILPEAENVDVSENKASQ